MNRTKHHIRKQVLDFQFSKRSRAAEWQRNVSFQYQQVYLKAMAAVLDEYEDGNNYQIDKLELNLGNISENQLTSRIKIELRKALVKKMNKKTEVLPKKKKYGINNELIHKEVTGEKKELFYSFSFFLSNGYFPWNTDIASVAVLEKLILDTWPVPVLTSQLTATSLLRKKRERARLYHQFSRSFATEIVAGYFQPQWNILETIYEFFENRLQEPIEHGHTPFKNTSEDEVSVMRWIALEAGQNLRQWPTEFAEWYLIRRLKKKIPASKQLISHLLKELHLKNETTIDIAVQLNKVIRGLEDNSDRRENKLTNDTTTFQNIRVSKEIEDPSQVNKDISPAPKKRKEQTIAFENEERQGEKTIEAPSSSESPDIKELQPLRKEIMKDAIPDKEFENKNIESRVEDDDSLKNEDHKAALVEKNKPKGSTTKQANKIDKEQGEHSESSIGVKDSSITEEITSKTWEQELEDMELIEAPEGYYLTHAGLILAWPYIFQLFEKLKYTRQKKFISKKQRERAVLLLGFIATGNPSCEEPQLILSKFLCGWPVQMPIVKNLTLSKKEQKEANTMLKGLIQNWKILKNTSIDGLRETFFLRDGKLVDEDEHWKLTIEQKGTDILLDHLPYGLSIIKLPWLKKMLKVDWA